MPDATPAVPKTAAQKVEGGINILKEVIVEIATLKRPVTAAAVAAFVVALIPGSGLTVTEATAILVGVGTVDAVLEQIV
jgi:hypothetical protein